MGIGRFAHDNRYKIFKSFLAYMTYFGLGSATTLLGSSLLDLQIRTGTDFATASYLIPVRSVGHILGSFLAGFIEPKLGQTLILTFTNIAAGVCLLIAPFFQQFLYVAIFLFIAGVNHGCAEIACNSLIASVWKVKCANWLQVLHMSWGIGSLLAPVICRPFLLPSTEEGPTAEVGQLIPMNLTWSNDSVTDDPTIKPIYTADDVQVQYAFAIIGAIAVLTAIPIAGVHLRERHLLKSISASQPTKKDISQRHSPWKVYTGVFLVAVISHLVYCIESTIGSLGASFSVLSDLHMDKKSGVLLATVFWSCFSFYRLIFIPLTFAIAETKLLILSLVFTGAGIAITCPWANHHEWAIWTGFTLIGIGISPIFSASYGMLASNINITGSISSIIFIPGVLGDSIHPGVASTLMATKPISLLYYILVVGILFIISFITLLIYCKKVFRSTTLHPIHRELGARVSNLSVSRH